MKLKNLFITLGLSLAVGVGALFGISKAPVKEAKAAISEGGIIAIEGKENWNGLGGSYQLRFANESGSETAIKDTEATVNNSGFHCYCYSAADFDFTPAKVQAYRDGKYSDYFNLSSMAETIWVPNDPGTSGGGTYSQANGYNVYTITASFSSAAPEGQQIYIGSDLNSWGFLDLNPNASRTIYSRKVFYNGSISSFQYKLLTAASGASKTWDTVIKDNGSGGNATATITDGAAALTTDDAYFDRAEVDCTLKVEFVSAVPSYVKILIRGSFNSWTSSIALAEMTRVTDTEFTYALEDIVEGNYEYKVIAEYSDATEATWGHQIDASNQTLVISESNQGQTITLGSTRDYDFAANMPQTYVKDGAVVRITFASPVPVTVDIIFAGVLTDWCTAPATLEKGKMTRVSATVYTWAIPSETHTGNTEYKIAAMAKYGNDTKVDYSTLVYGVLNTNEVLEINTTSSFYDLEALSTDLSELGALGLANGFLADMQTVCGTTESEWNEDHTGSTLNTAWANWREKFESLPAGAKGKFGSSEDATIVRARGLYLHCVARYSLAAWTGAPSASSITTVATAQVNNSAILLVIIISATALVAVGGYFLLKKKHN